MTMRVSGIGFTAVAVLLGACAVSSGCSGGKSKPAGTAPSRIELVPAGLEKVALDPSATDEFDVVASSVPAPGFVFYQAVIDYDESVIDMVEVQDIALKDSDPKAICIIFSDTDFNNDGNLMAEIDCGVPGAADPSNPDNSKAKKGNRVTLAHFKFKPIKAGTSPLVIVESRLETTTHDALPLENGDGYSVQVGGIK
jgi:hypothetical protein